MINNKKRICFVLIMVCIIILQCYLFGESAPISANINQNITIPSYYKRVKEMDDNLTLYKFTNIKDSSGENETLYRVYDGENFYRANANGAYEEKDKLSIEDINVEKPQPGITGDEKTGFVNDVQADVIGPDSSVRFNFLGQYLFNYAGSSNGYGGDEINNNFGGLIYDGIENLSIPLLDKAYGNRTSLFGSNNPATFNLTTGKLDTSITGNASKSTLTPSKNSKGEELKKENIKYAYLVTESSIDVNDGDVNSNFINKELQNILNRPMTLVGPSKKTINSNGYLPESIGTDTDNPTIIYSQYYLKPYAVGKIRASTITDVTDFVKQEGYGTYYGYNIPLRSTKPQKSVADVAVGWKLVVIEEDPTMEFKRSGVLEMGMINTQELIVGSSGLNLGIDLNNHTTPVNGDFNAQLFFSSVGSNPLQEQYEVKLNATKSGEEQTLKTKDLSGVGGINRGRKGEENSSVSFGQNIMTINGQRRTDMSSYRIASSGYTPRFSISDYQNKKGNYLTYTDGMDVELLNISNKKPTGSDSELHNAYIENGVSKINLKIPPSPDGDSYITILGIMTQIESPTFNSSITHKSLETGDQEDIGTLEQIEITATAQNVTSTDSTILGVSDTQVKISFDDNLDVSWDTLNLEFFNDGASTSRKFTEVKTTEDLEKKMELLI